LANDPIAKKKAEELARKKAQREIAKKVVKTIGKTAARKVFRVLDLAFPEPVGGDLGEQDFVTVYHKGELNRPSKPYLSTGEDRQRVEALDRTGTVHVFKIPKSTYWYWEKNGWIQTNWDLDIATGVRQKEIRFLLDAKKEILKYEVK